MVACKDVPLMLLRNIAPQFGLFNGATVYFHGLLYLPNDVDLQITIESFNQIKFVSNKVLEPFDVNPQGYASFTRFHQLPVNAVLLKIDDTPISSSSNINQIIHDKHILTCRFHLPCSPPALPDFIVVRSDDYKKRGGPNILGFENSDNLIPIPCVKIKREKPRKNDKSNPKPGYRIGFKVECAIVLTPYKLQGETNERQKTEIKESAHVPGLFYVAMSRTRHPKHNHTPDEQWPNPIDIQVQRLNPFVIEAEIFDRALKIKASQTLREKSVELGNNYGESWTLEECQIANYIALAWKSKITTIPAMVDFIERTTNIKMDRALLQKVEAKLNATDECLLKEDPPYLSDDEYNMLKQYQKPHQKKS